MTKPIAWQDKPQVILGRKIYALSEAIRTEAFLVQERIIASSADRAKVRRIAKATLRGWKREYRYSTVRSTITPLLFVSQEERLARRLQSRLLLHGAIQDVARVERTTRGLRKRVALQSAGVKREA